MPSASIGTKDLVRVVLHGRARMPRSENRKGDRVSLPAFGKHAPRILSLMIRDACGTAAHQMIASDTSIWRSSDGGELDSAVSCRAQKYSSRVQERTFL